MTQAWKGTRPTNDFSEYDQYYIDLALTIHEILGSYFHLLSPFGDEETEQNRLCIVLACYFEDYISEIDLWTTFRDECRDTLGRDLPFHNLEDYDPDYINKQDIALLIWVWGAAGFTHKLIDPQHRTIMILAETMYKLMEEHIDEAPATEMFDELLTIEDENKFFEVRNILVWLYSSSWLYGLLDMRMEFELEQEKMLNEMKEKVTDEMADIVHYELSLDYALNRTSRWGAVRMCDVAARLIKGNQTLKDRLIAMPKRISGNFKVTERGKKHHIFQHFDSRRKLRVNADSIDLKQLTTTDITTGLVRWGDEYWVNGSLALTKKPGKLEDSKGFLPYSLANKAERKEMRNMIANQDEIFLKEFQTRLYICEDRKDCEEAMTRFYTAMEIFNAKAKGRKPQLDSIPKMNMSDFPSGMKIAMFFTNGQGIQYSPLAVDLIDFLNTGESPEFDSPAEALMEMVGLGDLLLVQYLAENYPLDEVAKGIPFFDLKQDITPLCWFLDPKGSEKILPNISLINSTEE
jgi:hypothetical protein